MSKNPLIDLAALGQSVWYDNIHRAMIASGELSRMVAEDGLSGVTSNPTIFEKAIADSGDYDQALARLVRQCPGVDPRELFFSLAVEDIRAAADALRPVYDKTQGRDGFVSLEVSPDLANDAEKSIAEARGLCERLDRPNVMIKIPATKAGIPAIEQLIAEGINVNVTLLFSVGRYEEAARAYLRGLQRRLDQGLPIDRIASVASFFVSRVDGVVDAALEAAGQTDDGLRSRTAELMGGCGIANAKLAYRNYLRLYNSNEAKKLQEAGAQPQRLLWASTGVKNPAYSDVLYIETLIGPDTVNTMPPATYQAFKDHGRATPALQEDVESAAAAIAELQAFGIDLEAITERLESEGVAAFAKSFDNLLDTIGHKVADTAGGNSSAA